MKLHELKPAANATQSSKRIGRGQGSGKGGTSTKGHKGAQSRAGYSRKIGFEGGQMPIYRLVPKRGFKNINRVEYSPINLSTLQMLADKTQQTEITLELMKANGLISLKDKIKILGNGEITAKLTVTAHAFSKSAIAAIEKAGGKCVALMNKTEEVKVEKVEKKKEEKEKVAEKKVEEPKIEEPKVEEPKVGEVPVVEPPVVEEIPVAETSVVEEVPVVEETPVVPDTELLSEEAPLVEE
jgi:large subunit ribosomal protein L15